MKYRELLSIAKKYPNCCSIDRYTSLSAKKREDQEKVTVKMNDGKTK